MRAMNRRQRRGRPGHPGRSRRPGWARGVRWRVRPGVRRRVQGVRTVPEDPPDLMPGPDRRRWTDALFLATRHDGTVYCLDPEFNHPAALMRLAELAGLDLPPDLPDLEDLEGD